MTKYLVPSIIIRSILASLLFTTNSSAQIVLSIGQESVVIRGNSVSKIELVNYANKNIGWLTTYTEVSDTAMYFTTVSTEGKQPYKITEQRFNKNDILGLIEDVEVTKAFIDPEMKTNPKNYWHVSVAFKEKSGNYVDAGSTIELRDVGPKYMYKGTSYVVPFSDKKAANFFAQQVKQFAHTSK
jgi:hypothetical protein